MRGIKIPPQDFGLKMQGGLMREGGRICGTLRYIMVVYHHIVMLYVTVDTLFAKFHCMSSFLETLQCNN